MKTELLKTLQSMTAGHDRFKLDLTLLSNLTGKVRENLLYWLFILYLDGKIYISQEQGETFIKLV